MKKIILFIFTLLLTCCQKESQPEKSIPKLSVSEKVDDKDIELDIDNKISDSVYRIVKENQESIFNLYYSKNQNEAISFDSLTIKSKSNKQNVQKIGFKKDYFLMSYEITFSIDNDINFDGFNDIQISNYVGNYNATYSFWIFDQGKRKYIHDKSLDSINNPEINVNEKEIRSEWRVAFESFHFERYRWEKGKLILLEEKIKNNSITSDEIFETRKVLRNGKYYTTEKIRKK